MKEVKKIFLTLLVLGSALFANSCFFILTEGRQAIITRFGRPVRAIKSAGAHFKAPFVEKVRYVDKRILSWDGLPNQIPTKDKKYIKVDTTARWRIVDALKFIQTVQNERGAKARLDAILDASTRDIISGHNLVEAVRNSNAIFDDIKKGQSESTSNDIDKIEIGREQLSKMIAESAGVELTPFGIKIIDVQLRRISYESGVEQKVYERMISERQRMAQKIRSIGQGEKAKIEGRLQRDLQEIESKAYRRAQKLRGSSEAEAAAIFNTSLARDKEFYKFIRSVQAYKKSIRPDTQLILTPNSEFFKFLKKKN